MIRCCRYCNNRWVDVERAVTCHSVCQKYKEAKIASDKAKEAERLDRFLPMYVDGKAPARMLRAMSRPKKSLRG